MLCGWVCIGTGFILLDHPSGCIFFAILHKVCCCCHYFLVVLTVSYVYMCVLSCQALAFELINTRQCHGMMYYMLCVWGCCYNYAVCVCVCVYYMLCVCVLYAVCVRERERVYSMLSCQIVSTIRDMVITYSFTY